MNPERVPLLFRLKCCKCGPLFKHTSSVALKYSTQEDASLESYFGSTQLFITHTLDCTVLPQRSVKEILNIRHILPGPSIGSRYNVCSWFGVVICSYKAI